MHRNSKDIQEKKERKKSRNRLHNPFDGSQKASEQEHRQKKKYYRKQKYKPIIEDEDDYDY